MENTRTSTQKWQQQVEKLKPWFHNIHLPDGTQTAPDHFLKLDFPKVKWEQIAPFIPADLTGWNVLDIGCNAGFYTLELAKRGAHVLAIDVDTHYLTQARWVADVWGLADRIEFRHMQVYDLAQLDEQFDLIWFMGVLYHLRYPMLALDIVTMKAKNMLVFQTLTMPGDEVEIAPPDLSINDRQGMTKPGWPKMAFIENRLNNDPTNWWAPNHAGVEAMLRSCGMKVTAQAAHEIYICEADPTHQSSVQTWNKSEFLSAIGRLWLEEVAMKTAK